MCDFCPEADPITEESRMHFECTRLIYKYPKDFTELQTHYEWKEHAILIAIKVFLGAQKHDLTVQDVFEKKLRDREIKQCNSCAMLSDAERSTSKIYSLKADHSLDNMHRTQYFEDDALKEFQDTPLLCVFCRELIKQQSDEEFLFKNDRDFILRRACEHFGDVFKLIEKYAYRLAKERNEEHIYKRNYEAAYHIYQACCIAEGGYPDVERLPFTKKAFQAFIVYRRHLVTCR